jgi:hypothetical protein
MQKALSVMKRVAMIFGYDGLEKLIDIWVMRLRNFNKEFLAIGLLTNQSFYNASPFVSAMLDHSHFLFLQLYR